MTCILVEGRKSPLLVEEMDLVTSHLVLGGKYFFEKEMLPRGAA